MRLSTAVYVSSEFFKAGKTSRVSLFCVSVFWNAVVARSDGPISGTLLNFIKVYSLQCRHGGESELESDMSAHCRPPLLWEMTPAIILLPHLVSQAVVGAIRMVHDAPSSAQ